MSDDEVVYIGLGSNLEEPRRQIARAFDELNHLPSTRLAGASSLYGSAPLGPADQPDYVNAVACVTTTLEPLELLDALQALEKVHQRVRERHWGPRTLDLDILLIGDRQIDMPRLLVPHPYMHRREFVLQPLLEIAPDIEIPGKGAAAAWIDTCEDLQLVKLSRD